MCVCMYVCACGCVCVVGEGDVIVNLIRYDVVGWFILFFPANYNRKIQANRSQTQLSRYRGKFSVND